MFFVPRYFMVLVYRIRRGAEKNEDYIGFRYDGITPAELMRERIFDDSGCDDKNDEQSEHEQTLV